jgi:hypothetical protein
MARLGLLALCIGLVTYGAFGSVAAAEHRAYGCDSWADYHYSNEDIHLGYYFINWSDWSSTKDFIARRRNSYANVTYQQWVPGPGDHHTTTPDGSDLFRNTSIQRAGYSTAFSDEMEWTHWEC